MDGPGRYPCWDKAAWLGASDDVTCSGVGVGLGAGQVREPHLGDGWQRGPPGVAVMAARPCSSGETQAAPVSFSSQLHRVPRRGDLVVRAGDRHRRGLCLPAVPHCAGGHLLQSLQAVSVHRPGPEGAPAGVCWGPGPGDPASRGTGHVRASASQPDPPSVPNTHAARHSPHPKSINR